MQDACEREELYIKDIRRYNNIIRTKITPVHVIYAISNHNLISCVKCSSS
jgi:hypothetical protein